MGACAPDRPALDDPLAQEKATTPEDSTSTKLREPVAADHAMPASQTTAPPAFGQLSMAVVGEPAVDPLKASVVKPAEMVLIDFLYDGLTVWDVQQETWAPSLASELQMAADGMSWTVTLRQATFTDGTDLLAADVERTFRRVLDADTSLAATRLEMVTSVEAIDERTVRFDLSEPFANLPALLSSPVYGVVPDADVDGSVGSGPMALIDSLTLVPRKDLRLGLSGVRIEVVATPAAAIALWESGEVDLVYVGADFTGDVDVVADSTVEAHYVLNVQAESLQDLDVRRAVLNAISRSVVTVEGFGEAATVIERLVPVTLACDAPCGGEAVPEAVAVGSLSLAYAIDDDGREERFARALIGQFEAAGIDAEAIGYDLDGFVEAVGLGSHDLIRTGWVGLFPSPDSQLSPYMALSADNVSGYADAAFDQLIEAARTSGNAAFYDEARVLLDEAAVVLPLARLQVRALVSDSVTGLQFRHDGSIDLGSVEVKTVAEVD